MIFPQKQVTLKDGTSCILRSPAVEDAPEMLQYLLDTATQTEFLMNRPEEIAQRLTLAHEEKFLQQARENEFNYMIVAEVAGRVAGNASINREYHQKTRHRASIGIALREEFWGKGIGTLLLQELIQIGVNWGLRQVELEVFEGNVRAMALYRKMGFKLVAVKPDAVQFLDGTYRDEYVMVKRLHSEG